MNNEQLIVIYSAFCGMIPGMMKLYLSDDPIDNVSQNKLQSLTELLNFVQATS